MMADLKRYAGRFGRSLPWSNSQCEIKNFCQTKTWANEDITYESCENAKHNVSIFSPEETVCFSETLTSTDELWRQNPEEQNHHDNE
jgi:hypothetical protein